VYTISRTNRHTICYKSVGDPNLCKIRKYSVYTRYDFAYESVYESPYESVYDSKYDFMNFARQIQTYFSEQVSLLPVFL
jgi:hypothetical protein